MLDPILFHIPNLADIGLGRAIQDGKRGQLRALRRDGRSGDRDGGYEDRGEVEKTPRLIHYKKRSMRTRKNTDKTLERAIHTHPPHFTSL